MVLVIELILPVGVITLDKYPSDNYMFVSDGGNQRIPVFTVEGQFITVFDCGYYPRGITVDCGVVYVCNHSGNCVNLY